MTSKTAPDSGRAPAGPLATCDLSAAGDGRTVQLLSERTGASIETVRILLMAEVARLGGRAMVQTYVRVLAASNVRAALRLDRRGSRTQERR